MESEEFDPDYHQDKLEYVKLKVTILELYFFFFSSSEAVKILVHYTDSSESHCSEYTESISDVICKFF